MMPPHDADTDPGTPADIRGFVLGPFETNCYVVSHSGRCWIIDPGFDPAEVIDHVRHERLRPAAVLLTHAHADHIAGLHDVRGAFPDLPILIHAAERGWLADPARNLSLGLGMPVVAPEPTGSLEDGQILSIGDSRWRIIHTPGHSPGGVTLHNEAARVAIVGDTLFAGSIGRTDFPGSVHDTLIDSIRTRLYTLPDDTTIHPGHGPESTIGREKRSNPFVRG